MTEKDSETLIGSQTINEDSIGIEKPGFKSFFQKIKKKYLIAGGAALVFLILVIVIIVLATGNNAHKTDGENSGEGDDRDKNPEDSLGEIRATYEVYSNTKPTNILSSSFSKTSIIGVYVGNNRIGYTKEYTFKKGENEIRFLLFEDVNMDSMFKGLNQLLSIDISSQKNLKIKSMESAFEDCENLDSFNMKGCDTSQITSIKNIFSNTDIKNIDLEQFHLDNIKDMSYMFYKVKLKSIDLSKLNTEHVENMRGMFKDSTSLSSLDLSHFNTQNVKDMSSMFEGCSALKKIIFPPETFKTEKVTNMSSMFSGCVSLEELKIDFFNTGNVVDMSSMFKECSKIKILDINNFQTRNVENMKSMFESCGTLKTLKYSIDFSSVTDTSNMFKGDIQLNTLA